MRLLAVLAACIATAPVPTPVGFGPRYRLPAAGRPVSALACNRAPAPVESHVELFANQKALLIPAGVGIAKRCAYPVRTETPTGVVESAAGRTLADLFAVWGQPLSAHGLAGFHGAVHAWVGGCPWAGDVREIPLARHSEIVVEVGGYVPPHSFFLFPRNQRN